MPDSHYRPHIDGLRAVAIVLVVLFHARMPGFAGGYIGVDVFFVVSGYLIIGLLCREFERTGNLSLAGFFERRIRRLAPAMLLVLAATLVLGAVFLTPIGGEQQGLAKSALATLALSSNFYFAANTGGYFDAPTEMQPLLHTWSLAVEEQFYLFWPMVVLLVGRWSAKRTVGAARAIELSLAVLFVLSLAFSLWWTPYRPTLAFFMAPTRAWEFAAGGLAWFWLRRHPGRYRMGSAIAAIGIIGIVLSAALFDAASAFPGWRALLPVAGTVAVIVGCGVGGDNMASRALSLRPIVALGLLSYSWYLWHWPLLALARVHYLNEAGLLASLALCMLALLLAALTYRFVENPIRQRKVGLMATRRRAFAGAAAGIALLGPCSLSLGAWAKFAWDEDVSNASLRDSIDGVRKIRLACWQERPYSGHLRQDRECDLPTDGTPLRILVWGDSHASHAMPMVSAFAAGQSGSARIRFMPECPPLQAYSPLLVGIDRSTGCEAFNRDVLAEIRRERSNGLGSVLLAARWAPYLGNEKAAEAADAGLRATIGQLQRDGLRVFLLAPVPELPHDAPACLARRGNSECGLSREEAEAGRRQTMRWLENVVGGSPGVIVLDPLPALCSPERCNPMRSGVVLFSDSHHLSEAGSLAMLPSFSRAWSQATAMQTTRGR